MATITEDYVSFETAKLLKEKGFNERLLTLYITDEAKKEGYFQLMAFTDDKIDNNHSDYCYLAPTLQMAMKWLRIEHNIHIESFCPVVDTTDEPVKYNVVISDLRNYCLAFDTPLEDKEFDSYEEACEAAIKYCLEHLI